MNTNRIWLKPALVALVALGLVGGFLHHRGPRQSLGRAAVKLSHDALEGGENAQLRTNGVVMPIRLTGFESVPLEVSAEELRFLPSDTTFGRRLYRDDVDNFMAMISVVVMGTDRSSLHRPEQCLGSQGVEISSRQTVRIPTAAGELEVLRCNGQAPFATAGGNKMSRAVFAYLFIAADRQTSSHSQRHLLTMQDLLLRGVMPRWTGIQCFTRCKEGEEDATFEKMKRLLALAVPAMRSAGPPITPAR